jgi:hypothetical protein
MCGKFRNREKINQHFPNTKVFINDSASGMIEEALLKKDTLKV